MDPTNLEPEEQVEVYNQELADQQEQLHETVSKIDSLLEQDEDPEEEIDELNNRYRELSKKRTRFMAESEQFAPTKPLKPLKQPERNDYEGSRGLKAHEPDLLDHKQKLDQDKNITMQMAEKAYQRYRKQQGLEPVENMMDIPSVLDELEKLKEAKTSHIYAHRNYLQELKSINEGEKEPEESEYHIPENEQLIEDQIDRASREIYDAWDSIKTREENVQQAIQELRSDMGEKDPIHIGLKYGIRPLESSVEGRQNNILSISRELNRLGRTVKRDLPEEYSQRIEMRQEANM